MWEAIEKEYEFNRQPSDRKEAAEKIVELLDGFTMAEIETVLGMVDYLLKYGYRFQTKEREAQPPAS